jgi:hypothetical protein
MKKNAMSTGQARAIKLSGDKLRKCFEKQCTTNNGQINAEYLLGLNTTSLLGTYVLKAGNNWQFHLGSFEPYVNKWGVEYINSGKTIKFNCTNCVIENDLRSDKFLRLYMLKGNYFVIYDAPNWLIFNSEDIISLMTDTKLVNWRILESGRIKGDVYIDMLKRTIFTIEYRAEEHKKQFVFGAHGGNAGERLKKILKSQLLFNSVSVNYKLWTEFRKIQ